MLQFFTPDLYRRFNSPDDAIADRADADWELAIIAYKASLSPYLETMNDRVRTLAEGRSFHDAKLLSIREAALDPRSSLPPIALVSVADGGTITELVYILGGPFETTPPEADWPFSPSRVHWLYDEIQVRHPHPGLSPFLHAILLSDGRILSIPFVDVIIHSYAYPAPALDSQRRA